MNLIKARDAGQKLEDKKKKKAMKLKIKDMLKQKVTRVWTDDDTRMLRDLVAAQGKFNYGELRGQMPGFTYYQMYTALGRITRDENACGGWNIEERRALRRLAHEYPGDWRTVALHMPTRRSPEQCSMLYGRLLLGDATKVWRWTTEEDEQLKRMISTWRETLHTEPKPAESEKLEKLEKGSPKSQSFGRILQAFKRDVSSAIRAGSLAPRVDEAERLQQKKRDKRHAIPWTLIASYMDGRTAMQCKNRWYSKPVVQPTDACTELWTREEDLALFRLDVKLPGKKKNVQRFLPRFRSLPVIAVRRRLVMRYVEMLRACRPGWDPEADGLEEVHMRCEVASWYAATAEGYRPSDPYTCPFDMDLNGYQEWVASGKS
ncbi:hypothetical protein IWW50_001957 [Coemansia erecta]|nr:hypothetical protein IWW50_001957 [Coemansia erecta]